MIEHNTTSDKNIAERATMQSFLNCFLKETGTGEITEPRGLLTGVPSGSLVRCCLARQGIELLAPLRYQSPTGRHLFHFPLYYRSTERRPPLELDYVTLVALVAKELALTNGGDGAQDELLLRAIESCQNIERFVNGRRNDLENLYALESRFIDTEQSLVFGHHLHPTPKSRQGIAEAELARYSPELNGAFPLHYFRAHHSIVLEGSALPQTATALIKAGLRADPEVSEDFRARYCREDEYALIPVHPWQSDFLLRKPAVQKRMAQGLLEHLGPRGSAYLPTSSIRTVYHPDAAFMLKLSLNVKITNSVRANLRKELERGVEVHRIMESSIGLELRERFPCFDIIRDPAYITVDLDGPEESGFEVVLRQNVFPGDKPANVTSIVALCQDHLLGEGSRLARIIRYLAEREGRPTEAVALDWFQRYLDVALQPILWLYFMHGIAVEAHQQNSVLELQGGYPYKFYYRDNQGYYYCESVHDALEQLLPGISVKSQTTCVDAIADERLRYYFFINNLFGLINAFGVAGLTEEHVLLRALRLALVPLADVAPKSSKLIRSLLSDRTIPCKANLLTRFHDLDELVGDLATQSVYVDIENPLTQEV